LNGSVEKDNQPINIASIPLPSVQRTDFPWHATRLL
jgi:hypothetical protein